MGFPAAHAIARIKVVRLPVYPVTETRVIMICGTLILAGSLMAVQKPAEQGRRPQRPPSASLSATDRSFWVS